MAINKLPEFAKDGQKNTDDLVLIDGFPVLKKPARQWFNWLFNTLTVKINEVIDADFIPKDDIVDNLTTDDPSKPVSAKQAKNLKESITAIEDIVLYAPIAWPSTIIPAGHLALMGQTISQAMYPKLFALYGSKLPDMRAYSIKGLDYGRGIDSGRTVLTAQNDAIQNFTADFGVRPYVPNAGSGNAAVYPGNGFTVSKVLGGSNAKLIGDGTAQTEYTKVTLTVASLVRTSTETRVKNIAFLYIVKAG